MINAPDSSEMQHKNFCTVGNPIFQLVFHVVEAQNEMNQKF